MSQSSWCEAADDVLCIVPPSEGRLIVARARSASRRSSRPCRSRSTSRRAIPKGIACAPRWSACGWPKSCGCRPADRSALFYALLLKDLGCSSNAAKMSYLFGADDHLVKRSTRMIDWTKPGRVLQALLEALCAGRIGRRKAVEDGGHGPERSRRRPRRSPKSAASAAPTSPACCDCPKPRPGRSSSSTNIGTAAAARGLKGEEISLLGRICCLAQTVEVFFTAYGLESAIDVARSSGAASGSIRSWSTRCWPSGTTQRSGADCCSDDLLASSSRWEPEDAVLLADEACLDRVAEAFASVVDAKSPWTYQHSTRVAEISVGVAQQFGCRTESAARPAPRGAVARYRQTGRVEPDSRQGRQTDRRGIRPDPQTSRLFAADSRARSPRSSAGRRGRRPSRAARRSRLSPPARRDAASPGRPAC